MTSAAVSPSDLATLFPRRVARLCVMNTVCYDWGEDDTFQLVKYGERLAADIPDARLVRVKDARHFVMWDQPEAVARALAEFL